MEKNNEFKCPSCGSPILFDSNTQKLKCDSCATEIDVIAYKDYSEILNQPIQETQPSWNQNEPHYWNENDPFEHYVCQSCGGEIIGEKTTVTTSCPYCDNQVLITKNVQGILQPDYIIPFKLNKEMAKAEMLNHFKKKPFLPSTFKKDYKLEEIKGLYVPFWLFDGNAYGTMVFNGSRTTVWSDSKYRYTKTDFYSILREGTLSFEKIPVDGSRMLNDTLMESLEPFVASEILPFHPGYLSGFLANKYDVNSDETVTRANNRIKESVREIFKNDVQGYIGLHTVSEHLDIANGHKSYALYPIWLLTGKYMNKEYVFAMNGQTGKFVGDLPIDKSKVFMYGSTIFIILMILALIFCFFWGG